MEISDQDIRKFNKLAGELCKLLDDIRKYNPEAEIFLEAEGGLMLFAGDTRDDQDNFQWCNQRGRSYWTPGLGGGAV